MRLSALENVTIQDAVAALLDYTTFYKRFFDKILSIKRTAPLHPTEKTFRAHPQKSALRYETIEKHLLQFDAYLCRCATMLGEDQAEKKVALSILWSKIIQTTDKFIAAIQACYAGHATQFIFLLQDIEKLQQIIVAKGGADAMTMAAIIPSASDLEVDTAENCILADDELLVYVRIFHRQMAALLMPSSKNTGWIQPLLDSIRHPERHGFGIYATPEDVSKSLKDEQYGYVTLKIKKYQDITAQRAQRICPIVGCPLLSVTGITAKNLLSLTHAGRVYTIKNGVLIPRQLKGEAN